MKIRINSVYHATDGSVPESIEVEVEIPPEMGLLPESAASLVCGVMDRMSIYGQRYEATTAFGGQVKAAAASAADVVAADPATEPGGYNPHCRRTACGCRQNFHDSIDAEGRDVGKGNGQCTVCDNADKCRSFVGPSEPAPQSEPYSGIVAQYLIRKGEAIDAERATLLGVRSIRRAVSTSDTRGRAGADLYPGQPVQYMPTTQEWISREVIYLDRVDTNVYAAGDDLAPGDPVGFVDGVPVLWHAEKPHATSEIPIGKTMTPAGVAIDPIRKGDKVGDFRVLGGLRWGLWSPVFDDVKEAGQ